MNIQIAQSPVYEKSVVNVKENGAFLLQGEAWLSPLLKMHKAVREKLTARGEGHRLLPKQAPYFLDMLAEKTGRIVGVFSDAGRMTGFCAIAKFGDYKDARKAGALTYPDKDGRIKALVGEGEVGFIQSLCVDAGVRGPRNTHQTKSYAAQVLEVACRLAAQEVCKPPIPLFAQVSLDNACSLKKFFENGFVAVGLWTHGAGKGAIQKLLLQHIGVERAQALGQEAPVTITIADGLPTKGIAQKMRPHLQVGHALVPLPRKDGDKQTVFAVVPQL